MDGGHGLVQRNRIRHKTEREYGWKGEGNGFVLDKTCGGGDLFKSVWLRIFQ